MVAKEDLKFGAEVHYQPKHFSKDQYENGLVKEIREDTVHSVWVVYNCGGNWHRFTDYTGAKTNLTDLHLGWSHD